MSATKSTRIRRLAVYVGVVAIAGVSLFGCAQKYTAERDGKDLGDALCDVKSATTPQEVQSARAKVKSEMDSLASNYAMFTSEDRADIEENVTDLREHVAQGNEQLVQQDLTVIRRSLGNVADDLDDTSQAAWDGVKEAVDDCLAG